MELSAKTFIFSMLIILILGSIFFFILHRLANPGESVSTLINKYIPVSQKPASLILNVNAPNDNQLVFDNAMLVSGTTDPNSLVVVADQSFDHVIESNNQGNFSDTVTLDPGINELTITAFNPNGDTKQSIKTVYFSKTQI